MAPTTQGQPAELRHSAQAGVNNGSDPRTFYPFCGAGDWSKPMAYETVERALEDPNLLEHVSHSGA